MLYFRSCPRCHIGTIEFTLDYDGPCLTCLNCGYSKLGKNSWLSRHEEKLGATPSQTPPSLIFGAASAPTEVPLFEDEEDMPYPATA